MGVDHESKCKKCGKCCYAKIMFNGVGYFIPKSCKYLDTKTNLCTIYEKRYEIPDGCIPFHQALLDNVFPSDCPYVQDIPNYVAPLPAEELKRVMSKKQWKDLLSYCKLL